MALFKPVRTTSKKLNTVPKKEGQLIVCKDTKRVYLDTSATERIELYQSETKTPVFDGETLTLYSSVLWK